MPALLMTFFVFQLEGKDSIALLDCVLSFGIVGLEGAVDRIKGSGGREGIYITSANLCHGDTHMSIVPEAYRSSVT